MHKQPTAGPIGPASHNLSAGETRTSDDPFGLRAALAAAEEQSRPRDYAPGELIELQRADDRAPRSRHPLGCTHADLCRMPDDWISDDNSRSRSRGLWMLLGPTDALIAVGLTQHQAMAAAGLGVDLPAGHRVAFLSVLGDLAAFAAVLDPLLSGWSCAPSPELREQERRLYLALGAAQREQISARFAAEPNVDPTAEPELLLELDTAELTLQPALVRR